MRNFLPWSLNSSFMLFLCCSYSIKDPIGIQLRPKTSPFMTLKNSKIYKKKIQIYTICTRLWTKKKFYSVLLFEIEESSSLKLYLLLFFSLKFFFFYLPSQWFLVEWFPAYLPFWERFVITYKQCSVASTFIIFIIIFLQCKIRIYNKH